MLMHVVHGGAQVPEQVDALVHAELPHVAIHIDGVAFDVLHHEVRRAFLGGAAIEQMRDVRMAQLREDLPLSLEPAQQRVGVEPRLQQLDRDLLLVLLVVAHCLEHLAHAAAAGFVDDAIGAEPPPDPVLLRRCARQSDALRGFFFDERAGRVVRFQQRDDFDAQLLVAGAGSFDVGAALRGFLLERRAENFLDAAPALGRHQRLLPSSRRSQARASVHSRFTVASEMPMASAVCSTVSPPK